MNPANREGWGPSPATGSANGLQNHEQPQSQASRPLGSFSVGASNQQQTQQPPSAQASGPVLPPPSAPFFSSNQGNQTAGHNLPGLAGLTQPAQSSSGQPSQRPQSSSQDPAPPSQPHQSSLQSAGYPLPAISQTLQQQQQQPQPQQQQQQHPQPQANIDRDRELRDKEMMERHNDELNMREVADQREREMRERQQHEQAAHENHAGSIQIHQPVAVGPQVRAIHGPNGLLGGAGPMAGPNALSASLGAPSGPGNMFGGVPIQQTDAAPRMPHPTQQPPSTMLMPFSGPGGQQGPLGMGQGQQPILNDALSYLDQVKVQFVDHPDVYNRFLDIMKDFKSGAIDTPGVIDRVSTLFAGNPNLIQGFNTFLPPGYKIECGTGDDPNAIRVTTPMGTTVSSMPVPRPLSNPRPGPANGSGPSTGERQVFDAPARGAASWAPQQQQQQPGTATSDGLFSPSNRAVAQPIFGTQAVPNPQVPLSPEATMQREQQAAAGNVPTMAQQHEQRMVSQLQNAAAATSGGLNRQVLSPPGGTATPLPGQGMNGTNAQAGLGPAGEKRGPVEFNHAISYVNKIKNRFASQPDIYKQFLEILQTYQRESKPIQDVYAQVTSLFSSAPDLLEDFKQFLPESAAQHRAAQAARQAAEDGVMTSNIRGEPSYHAAQPQHLQSTPRADQPRLPPLGNFAPTPTANRDNKRKRGDRQGTAASSAAMPATIASEVGGSNRPGYVQANNLNKRAKPNQPSKQPIIPEGPAVSPTLTPALPEPLPPSTSAAPSPEELAFFDKVKKHIGNKNAMNEFLKLCNLYSQDLIDENLLVHRAQAFIGNQAELMNWFKAFLHYKPQDASIEAKAQTSPGRISLSNCRGLGPSYRMLPDRERLKPCSGRDDLCKSVLNDVWASHPTWASEDSGFVAHRKNQYEEGLHRIEEERHDYDHNIEACLRTIQQLDPIAQQLLAMSPEERMAFVLPPTLGGQSETIYKRVIMKIYGRIQGRAVIESLFSQPFNVIPILLNRMKQKLEEWKAAQREWEKVWREQTQKMFWKSLDHQSIGAKQADKRQFQLKTLQNEIQVKYEEQRRQREIQQISVPPYQFSYGFEDVDVLVDATKLILSFGEQAHNGDIGRLTAFMKEFVPLFFGLDPVRFEEGIQFSAHSSPGNDADDETRSMDDGYSPRYRPNPKKSNLLHTVLDRKRGGKGSRKDKEESAASSRGSTPDVGSAIDEEMTGTLDSPNDSGANGDSGIERWTEHPVEGNVINSRDVASNEPYRRDTYNMYCNLSIYCFFRMLVILYERLSNLKQNEQTVHEIVRRAQMAKPAVALKMIDRLPNEFFRHTSPTANYYEQVLQMFDEQIKGDVDMSHVEETLRRYYLQHGWQLYSIDRLLSALVRFALVILNNESKDKTWEIYQLFKKDRAREETTHQDELNYRKQVEKFSKDGDVYKISFNQPTMKASVQIFKKDDATFDPSYLSPETRWRYYIASWTAVEPTEGVPGSRVNTPFLKNSLSTPDENSEEAASAYEAVKSEENLVIRVCVNTYKLFFSRNTEEYVILSDATRIGGEEGRLEAEKEHEERTNAAHVKLVMNNAWMKGLSKDDVDAKKQAFRRAADGETAAEAKNEDEEMRDA